MRLTKRQLKRIIREEYTRLKRRGLIRESEEMTYEQEEQDEFLSEQIAQYEGEISQAIMDCAMIGYDEQESNPDSNSPESALANAMAFHGKSSSGDQEILTLAYNCGPFKEVIDMMGEEQRSMFAGQSAPRHLVFDLLVDYGIVEQLCMDFQSVVYGE